MCKGAWSIIGHPCRRRSREGAARPVQRPVPQLPRLGPQGDGTEETASARGPPGLEEHRERMRAELTSERIGLRPEGSQDQKCIGLS